MNAAQAARITVLTSGLAFACLLPRPCRAQAEINPDHYDDQSVSAPAITAAANPARLTVAKAAPGIPQTAETRNRRHSQPNLTGTNRPAVARLHFPKLARKTDPKPDPKRPDTPCHPESPIARHFHS
jgi:hypothetical protein